MEKDPIPYPIDSEEAPDRKRVVLMLPLPIHAQLEAAVQVWNEMNLALGRTRGRKWSLASVAERFVTLELSAFFRRYGGAPTTPEALAEVTRKAVADVRKAAKHSLPK